MHDISNDADCSKEVTFEGLIDEKIVSRGNIPSPKFSKGILHANRKSNNFGHVKDNRKILKTDLCQIGVKHSNGDFTSGLARPLAAEIVFLPFSAITKALITSKRYKIDGKFL
jgi:hypothetical protein